MYSKTTNCVSKVNFSEEIEKGLGHNEEERNLLVFPYFLTQSGVLITFVDEEHITFAHLASDGESGEVEETLVLTSDTNSDFSEQSEVPLSRACTTRSGRVVRAYLWLDI